MPQTLSRRIVVLTSVIGYGVYFPALITSRQLQEQGIGTEVFILEHLLSAEKREVFKKSREAFRKNYKLAKLAAKFPMQYGDNLDQTALDVLLAGWLKNNVTHFLCFSGLWIDIVKRYQQMQPGVTVHCCRIDAGVSPAWEIQESHQGLIKDTFCFFNPAESKINYLLKLPFDPADLIPYEDRPKAVLIHGGGWGLGGYVQRTQELAGTDFVRNIMIHEPGEYDAREKGVRYFLNDPDWDPLKTAKDAYHTFPPFGEVTSATQATVYRQFTAHPGILSVITRSRAIISKPGGMSLVEALMTETPLVYFEPMGANEEGNIRICEAFGVGISYDSWKEKNFSDELLRAAHHRIRKAKQNIPEFLEAYLDQLTVHSL